MTDDFHEATHAALERVRSVFDPELFAEFSSVWRDSLIAHLEQVSARKTKVLNWDPPQKNIELAHHYLQQGNQANFDTSALVTRFRQLLKASLDHGQNLHHPKYIGHQVPASVPLAGLFDALGAVTNQVMAVYEMGPW
ncbi:MAG: hypothetical protein KDA65_06990, partial [Planctomycetaceae bacterium]|nr:hypothetical protein [Planctomycetaceae bacterium]